MPPLNMKAMAMGTTEMAGGSYPVLFGAAGGLMALLCLLALAFPRAARGRSAA